MGKSRPSTSFKIFLWTLKFHQTNPSAVLWWIPNTTSLKPPSLSLLSAIQSKICLGFAQKQLSLSRLEWAMNWRLGCRLRILLAISATFPHTHHLNPGHAPIVFLALSRAVSDNNSRQTPLVTGPPFRLLSLKFSGSLLCKDIRPHRKVSLVHAEK